VLFRSNGRGLVRGLGTKGFLGEFVVGHAAGTGEFVFVEKSFDEVFFDSGDSTEEIPDEAPGNGVIDAVLEEAEEFGEWAAGIDFATAKELHPFESFAKAFSLRIDEGHRDEENVANKRLSVIEHIGKCPRNAHLFTPRD